MTMNQEIAERLGAELDGDLIMCIEGACITEAEWGADPDSCLQRIRGAMEEMEYD